MAAAGAAARGRSERLTIFYTAETHGTLEPCGCTSDPLGDIARYATLVREARKQGNAGAAGRRGRAVVPGEQHARRKRRPTRCARRSWPTELGKLGPFAAGLAETDIGAGRRDVVPRAAGGQPGARRRRWRRRCSRRSAASGSACSASPIRRWARALGVEARGSGRGGAARGRAAARGGRRAGRRAGARSTSRSRAGWRARRRVDLVVLGRQVGTGMPRAEHVGNAFLVAPADELQRVGRIDIVWRGRGTARRRGRARGGRAPARRDRPGGRAARRAARGLERPRAAAIAAFIAAKRARARSAARGAQGGWTRPGRPPATGSYFTNRLIPLRRSLPRDQKIAAAMRKLDAQIGGAEPASAAPPPPPEPGRPYYVGDAKCASCHKTALAFWKKTVHAGAWKTLVEGGKQNDYKCVELPRHRLRRGRRHQPGPHQEACATCSARSATARARSTSPRRGWRSRWRSTRRRRPAPAPTCHNEQHSDTFQYEAYLRDILGPGHGAERAQEAGRRPDGPRAADRRARAREEGRQGAGETKLPKAEPRVGLGPRSLGPEALRAAAFRRRRRRRRSAAGRADRARCCRR